MAESILRHLRFDAIGTGEGERATADYVIPAPGSGESEVGSDKLSPGVGSGVPRGRGKRRQRILATAVNPILIILALGTLKKKRVF